MRGPLIRIGALAGALGAAVACAATGTEDSNIEPPIDPADGGTTLPEDSGAPSPSPRDAADEGFGERPVCSEAGWCLTTLPSSDLNLIDVWPVGARAFALAESQTLGPKFLEWDKDGGWKFIDEVPEVHMLNVVRTVWAPDENEVFYAFDDLSALLGTGPSGVVIFHGKRPSPPETTWSWTKSKVDCGVGVFFPGQTAVWGTGPDDIYALGCGTIHRLNRSGASEVWELDYADSDPMYPIELSGAAGTGPGDVWFNATRGFSWGDQCTVLLHKTADGYTTVVDATPTPGAGCVEREGLPMIKGALAQIHAPGKDRVIGVTTVAGSPVVDNELVLVTATGGSAAVTTTSPAATMDVALKSPWGTSADDLWVLSNRTASSGTSILRAKSVWNDGGAFEFSTIALNGAPNTEELSRLRGTSNHNIWAVGRDRAYWKSTP